jgi:hypothetical protein
LSQPMRDCPFCHNEVPVGASRCKHCFNGLTVGEEGGKGSPVFGLVLLLLVFVAAGGWSVSSLYDQEQLGNVTIDPAGERIVLVYTGIEKEPTTRQLEFENLSGVEMHAGDYMIGGSHWEVYVITSAGERVLVNKSQTTTLEQYARTVSKHTGKQLTIINNIKAGRDTFGLNEEDKPK